MQGELVHLQAPIYHTGVVVTGGTNDNNRGRGPGMNIPALVGRKELLL